MIFCCFQKILDNVFVPYLGVEQNAVNLLIAMLCRKYSAVSASGYGESFDSTEKDNAAMRKVIKKLGFQPFTEESEI